MTGVSPFDRTLGQPLDVCLVVEGCYPHIAGGVSTWVDWLIRSLPEVRFGAVSLVAPVGDRTARYPFPDNLLQFQEVVMGDHPAPRRGWSQSLAPSAERLAGALVAFLKEGRLTTLREIVALVNDPKRPVPLWALEQGPYAFELCRISYLQLMPHGSFRDFFWAWSSLMGGLFAVLKAPLPATRVVHTISTGYAGLLAARAAIEGASRVFITEHGIYTNERRIEILMADWVVDTVDKGLSIRDQRTDLRDLWIMAFESYARCCYEACDAITTLFGDNQPMQKALGADPERLRVIPNGIPVERFSSIGPVPSQARPTAALIGRVVPIKDIKTFIEAADRMRRTIPDVHAVIAGPVDEDPAYAAECREMVARRGLEETVSFLGRVDVRELLAVSHVVVLTSLSEAQPLTVLEAGAAGRPCVTTNVGACREMIEGAGNDPAFEGPGGVVTDILDAEAIAEAVSRLLADADLRRTMGENLRRRVARSYASDLSADRYRALYDRAPATKAA
ncbi:GT4 family glycosyltransferase PelF [Aureimonas ureilytica]|uniref:GT4 family glycosyltransferase PelF n=1 Tax=Aureimonas ureilytica TaxID=401562 RepID=UPI00036308C6|nr:GT4 family glycosyltransferase PelF [Aureimonas ureilytica]